MSRRKFIKKTLILLISLTLIFTLAACNEEEELVQEVKVEKEIPEYVLVREERHEENGEISGLVEYEYDDRGNVTRITYKNGDGEVIENKEYKYNEKGLKVERNITKVVEDTSKYRWRSGSYDLEELDEERIIRENMYETLGKSTYKYNSRNQLILYEKYNSNGEKVEWISFEYHRNGNMKCRKRDTIGGFKKTTEYNRDGKWTKVVSYFPYNGSKKIEIAKYDRDGNWINYSIKKYNNKGKVTSVRITNKEYDNKGNMIRHICKLNGELFSKYDFEYDKNGNLIKEIKYYKTGKIEWIREYRYDERGNMIYRIEKRGDGSVYNKVEINYTYDKNNNLIKVQGKDLLYNETHGWIEYKYEKLGKEG
ncbi:MAG: hypothetical protein FH762_19765 [Firmicutes bacterium]|nr:hypothetical protein [Bacillota bacterium]